MKRPRVTLLLVLLACSIVPLARGQATPTSMDLFRKGSDFFLLKNYRSAANYLQQALDLEKQDPELPQDYWRVLIDNLAMSYGLLGDLKRSREVLEYGISKDPTYPNFHYTLACAYAESDDLDHTLEELRSAFKYKANIIAGEQMPDPRLDESFQRFRSNERFQGLMASLYRQRRANAAPAEGPPGAATKARPNRRIYFVPFAEFPTVALEELADYYRQKYELKIEILPSMSIPDSAVDNERGQLIAERLLVELGSARR